MIIHTNLFHYASTIALNLTPMLPSVFCIVFFHKRFPIRSVSVLDIFMKIVNILIIWFLLDFTLDLWH